ncbi:MAG TPA: hypothetical protein PLK12_10725 [Prolixibacteraceae bacterium]|nr:hypothetical protein [Prolixibacteraceae bacterium]
MGFILCFLLPLSLFPQSGSYSFLVGGHAYGAHNGVNAGIHPPFKKLLYENAPLDSGVIGLFLTGDIIRQSNPTSWQTAEEELAFLPYPSFYVMGNHDNNSEGHSVFAAKHGGAFYSFVRENDLFLVLNSTETDRSISREQLLFLENELTHIPRDSGRVFLFFHEVLWNSHEKYRGVKSNSRSRYDEIRTKSNFWHELVPLLAPYSGLSFYFFAGDVGGNTDAIALFYDRIANMYLFASGMGEVADENYLKVEVAPDTVVVKAIPLDPQFILDPIYYYNVPDSPDEIMGPRLVSPGSGGIEYSVDPVFNATSYRWLLPANTAGSSRESGIRIDFGPGYSTDTLWVWAEREGYGESGPACLLIESKPDAVANERFHEESPTDLFLFAVHAEQLIIIPKNNRNQSAYVRMWDHNGKLLAKKQIDRGSSDPILVPSRPLYILDVTTEKGRSICPFGMVGPGR